MIDDQEQFLDNILYSIQSIASGDFSSRIENESDNEILNVIALGINMLGEEINRLFQDQKRILEELQHKNELLINSQEEINLMNEELRTSNEELATMNEDLISSQNELSKLNNNLEQKVKERTEKVEKLLNQKNAFIAQLGHDLKTPLGPLINLIPIIENNTDDPKVLRMLNVVSKSTIRLRDLMNKILKLVVLDAPSTSLKIESADIVTEIELIIDRFQNIFDENEIYVENKIQGELICDFDKVYFAELMENLLTNAIKYGGLERRKILLDYTYDNDQITLTISDNGRGLTETQIQQIFDEFYKVDGSRHDLSSHGLGLNIGKKIVEKHHGKIWAESLGLGRGTTFFISLPWKQKED